MSGDAWGLLLVPLLLGPALPFVVGGIAVTAAVSAGANAASQAAKAEQERKQRQAIQQSNASRNVGNYRQTMHNDMTQQTQLNTQASQEMMRQLELQRREMQAISEKKDLEALQNYINDIKEYHTDTFRQLTETQETFNRNYRDAITESMGKVSQEISQNYEKFLNELQQIQSDENQKQALAAEIANSYIQEAQTLMNSLVNEFEGQKFSARQIATLTEQFNQAVSLYNKGRYESSIASAKDVVINTLEEIYDADAKLQEWENYYKLALVLSEEIKTYIEDQEIITEEVKKAAEEYSGKTLEDEIVGIKVSDYTDKNAKGQTRYDYLMHKINETYDALRAPNARQLSTDQLKECAEFLNNELYPAVGRCINRAILNMNNAFSRQNISEEIIDFFEEHNFMFNGYAYDDDAHDKTLHIGLENQATGEELIISLAPELQSDGNIQTHVDLKQIKGDEANEERKAYYRQCIENVAKGSNPYAQLEMKCDSKTKNKLSADTETKKKLKK